MESKPNINDATYDIEDIVDARWIDGYWQYLVKWKHYLNESNSWVSEGSFDSNQIILNFWKKNKMSDFKLPSKVAFFPKNSIEISKPLKTSFLKEIYPEITSSNIEEIIGLKRINGYLIALVNVSNYPRPIKIPTKVLHKLAPKKLIQFYESQIVIN